MADPPAYPDSGDEPGVGRDRESPEGTPRWVKVFGLIALVVVLLFVVLLLIGGPHNPGRHMRGGGSGAQILAARAPDHGEQQP